MAKKKRIRTNDFTLGLQSNGQLPSKEEVNSVVAKATNQTPVVEENSKKEEKQKRIPFTTAITPENRAILEAAAHERKESVADLLNMALEHYFKEVSPLQDEDLKKVFVKLFKAKVK